VLWHDRECWWAREGIYLVTRVREAVSCILRCEGLNLACFRQTAMYEDERGMICNISWMSNESRYMHLHSPNWHCDTPAQRVDIKRFLPRVAVSARIVICSSAPRHSSAVLACTVINNPQPSHSSPRTHYTLL
jgi:hypothetical protein